MSKKNTTIASGQTVGVATDLTPTRKAVGLVLPAALTGTAITFQASVDNTTYVPVRTMDGSAAYSVTVAASRYVPLDDRVMAGIRYIKLVSGSAEAADRIITIVTAHRVG